MAIAERTQLLDLSREEYLAFLEREVRRALGIGVEVFVDRYRAGEYDEADPEVARLVALVGPGQDGR